MPNSVAQRIGPATRTLLYLETTRGADPGSPIGFVLPLRDAHSFIISRAEAEAPYFNGGMQGFNSAPADLNAQGAIPLGLEFLTSPNLLKMGYGTGGYSRVALVTGSVHNFFPPAAPTPIAAISGQIQDEYLEGTPIYQRARYVMLQSFALAYANGGVAPLDVNLTGSGDNAFTDLAGTKNENGYSGISVFNGQARIAIAALNPTWFVLSGATAFRAMADFQTAAENAAFNDGVAVSVNPSIPMLKGTLEMAMAQTGANPENDFNFLNYAINRNIMSCDWVWTDAPFAAAPFPSSFMRLTVATSRFSRKGPTAGGRPGKRIGQDWMHILDSTFSKIAADSFGTVVGPYLIGATTNILSINVDGLGASSVTLTQGAARTAAQICADINGDATIGPRAVADVFCGRVRITSKQTGGTGASSSVALTAATNNANAILGFNTTSITGFNAPYVFRVYNALNINY